MPLNMRGVSAVGKGMAEMHYKGLRAEHLKATGMPKKLRALGLDARKKAMKYAPASERKTRPPSYDKSPQGRVYPWYKPGLMKRAGGYSIVLHKGGKRLRLKAGTGERNTPQKAIVGATSTRVGYGVQYGGGGTPRRSKLLFKSRVLGNRFAATAPYRKGRKKKVAPYNWVQKAIDKTIKRHAKGILDAYQQAVGRQLASIAKRAVRRR